MNDELEKKVAAAKKGALEILLHNNKGPNKGLPRSSGFDSGYHEPYTRDLMIASLGFLITDNQELTASLRNVLETLAKIQTKRGHIPGWVHDDSIRGSSDTTPLFILVVSFFREKTGEEDFLEAAFQKAKLWMEYQSPDDSGLVAQTEVSDWRDELWGFHGVCLYVNTIVYSYLRLSKNKSDYVRAEVIKNLINHPITYGLLTTHENFYAMCVSKRCIRNSENMDNFNKWFDLLGNSLAILAGTASPAMAQNIISWVENRCKEMQVNKELGLDLPPNFFPFVTQTDPQWCARYELHCRPGNYLNGGIWPFACGFYIAALVAAGAIELAKKKLAALTDLVKFKREPFSATEKENLEENSFGFNEWFKAQNEWSQGQNKTRDESLKPQDEWFKARNDRGDPIMGHNWQTWSAAMYLYAAKCVETNSTPFFDKIRGE